jgi:hypothetical protein
MGGRYLVPLSAENRASAGVAAGDNVEVEIELDTAERVLDVPDDLVAAIAADPAAHRSGTRSLYSRRRRIVLSVEGAKAAETRARRIEKSVADLQAASLIPDSDRGQTVVMPVAFNHTIVHSATWTSRPRSSPDDGSAAPRPFGPFLARAGRTRRDVRFAQAADDEEIHPQHYAFLGDRGRFRCDLRPHPRAGDRALSRTALRPGSTRSTTTTAAAACYWCDPSGHFLEIITVPYGGWPDGSDRRP